MHTKESLMEQAQVFASAWSLIGGPFDCGDGLDNAEQARTELAEAVDAIVRQRDELLATIRQAAEEIRRCDYTPARSTLLVAITKSEAA